MKHEMSNETNAVFARYVDMVNTLGRMVDTLTLELDQLKAELDKLSDEKERRIYYQNIVYEACQMLDHFADGVVVCGTIEEPSTDVQQTLKNVIRQRMVAVSDVATLEAELEAVKGTIEGLLELSTNGVYFNHGGSYCRIAFPVDDSGCDKELHGDDAVHAIKLALQALAQKRGK